MNYNGRLTGSLADFHATMDSNGKLAEFDAISGADPIVQASISEGMLVINTEAINEAIAPWNMTLTGDPKHLGADIGRVLHIDHLFARMQRLNTNEAKTNAITRIGSNLSQILPLPFSCE
jgi:hypothetical protein